MGVTWEVVAWGKDTYDPIHYCRSKKDAERLAEKLNKDPNYQGEGYGAYIQQVDDDGIID